MLTIEEFKKYFLVADRASRSEYWAVFGISFTVLAVGWLCYYATALSGCVEKDYGLFLCGGYYGVLSKPEDHDSIFLVPMGNPFMLWFVLVPFMVFALWLYFSAAARRLLDLKLNPWIAISIAIPFFGVIPALAIGALPSSEK